MVNGLAYSPDGLRLALAGFDGLVRVWDAVDGRELLTLRGHESGVHSVAFSPDGLQLASGDGDGLILVWDLASGERLLKIRAHSTVVFWLAYHPRSEGQRLASTTFNPFTSRSEVRLWDTVLGREALTLPGGIAVAWSFDGRYLAAPGSGSLAESRVVQVWDGGPWSPPPAVTRPGGE